MYIPTATLRDVTVGLTAIRVLAHSNSTDGDLDLAKWNIDLRSLGFYVGSALHTLRNSSRIAIYMMSPKSD